ncbi:MAG: DUF6157 family protein [Bacteroidetes bacterium]|nr:DUF6157 family protein [Bacteroidota bacterium]
MKTHTTNYFDTFIEIAEDTKAACGEKPKSKGDSRTVAEMQYEMISRNPYRFTSDEVLFEIFAKRNDVPETEKENARNAYFSKGQACFRASPLTKTYGFGVHFDAEGKMAIYPMESEQYEKFINDNAIKKLKAMRSSKK